MESALIRDFIWDALQETPINWLAYFYAVIAILTSVHTIINKRDARSAAGWLLLIWFSPIVGALLYYLFGINRIRRRVLNLRQNALASLGRHDRAMLKAEATSLAPHFTPEARELIAFGERLTRTPLTQGNAVTPFATATGAYDAMLEAIESARSTVMLSTYIFANDATGQRFVAALGRAVRRGVEVRVLVDATGARYSFPTIMGRLKREKVRAACFLPHRLPGALATFNLRNHRKLLIVDGFAGFTGGLNISSQYDGMRGGRKPYADMHFRLDGPVVAHMRSAFVEDWAFAARETLVDPLWLPPIPHRGTIEARGIIDGPDLDFEKLQLMFMRALTAARHTIRIMTPYFLPDPTTLNFLRIAALGGITVEILVPAKSNIPLMDWAFRASIGPLLEAGCHVWLGAPPFDHSKLFLVDDYWCSFGSANWDARSLKLNFEFNVECYDGALNESLTATFERKRHAARRLTREDIAGRGFLVALRDSTAELFSPLL